MYYEDDVLHKRRLEASMPHPVNVQMDISKDQFIDPPSFNSPIEITPLKATKAFIEDDSNKSIIKVIKENNIMEHYLTLMETNEELEGIFLKTKLYKDFQKINTYIYYTIWLNFSYIFLLVWIFWLPYTIYFKDYISQIMLILAGLFNFFDQIIFITRQKQQNRGMLINLKNVVNSNTILIVLIIFTISFIEIACYLCLLISILQIYKLNKVTTTILIRIKFPILKYKNLMTVFIIYLWIIHAQACIWWLLIQDYQEIEQPYTYCFYVSVTIITGQFAQSIHNQQSMIFVSIMMIISVLINYHLLFTGYSSFSETSKSSVAFWNQLENMKLKLQKTNIPKINQFITLNQMKKLKSDRDIDEQIKRIYHIRILENIQSLQTNFSKQTIRQLSTKIQEIQGERGDKFNKNGLYIIEQGVLNLNYESEYANHRLKELKDGQFFGEVELFTNQSQSLSLECQMKCKILFLSSEDFFQTMLLCKEKGNILQYSEKFHFIKDSLQFGQNPQLIASQCYVCKENHLFQNCSLVKYVPDKSIFLANENQSRQYYFRKYFQNRRRHKALKKVKEYNKHNLQSSICSDYVEDDESDYSSDEDSVQSQQMKNNKSFNLLSSNLGNAGNAISNEVQQGDMQSEKFSVDYASQFISNPHVFSKKQIETSLSWRKSQKFQELVTPDDIDKIHSYKYFFPDHNIEQLILKIV